MSPFQEKKVTITLTLVHREKHAFRFIPQIFQQKKKKSP